MTSASLIPRISYLILTAVNEQYPSLLCLTVNVNEWCIVICNIKVVLFYSYIYIIWLPLAYVNREHSLVSGSGPTPSCPSYCHTDVWLQITAIKAWHCYCYHLLKCTQCRKKKRKSVCVCACVMHCTVTRVCYFCVTNCSVVAVPLGGHHEVNWMYLQLS